MEEVDNFPFDSVEDFERAVGEVLCRVHSPIKNNFAFAPPIHVYNSEESPPIAYPRSLGEEEKRKSPNARSAQLKEYMEEMVKMEARIDEKLEQLHALYFYLSDRIKRLENKK